MKVSRRTFLKIVGATGTATLVSGPRQIHGARLVPRSDESPAMLVDTTRCIGCRACEAACSEANRLPKPATQGQESVFEKKRTTDSSTYAVINRYTNPKDERTPTYVRTQCMHCVQPACASACPVAALEKTPEGPVVYHADRCLGCRYCMLACPFGIPKFEYEKPIPYIRKCCFCIDRLQRGKVPACAEVCPTGALRFGKRKELLEIARTQIYQNPERYVHHIYGEHEVGGTGWLYITNVPFEQLDFRMDLGTTSYPELTRIFLSSVPFVLMLWPPLLMGIYSLRKSREKAAQVEAAEEKETRHE
jgi:Fe-S-cluster-containing dehydrogenase component